VWQERRERYVCLVGLAILWVSLTGSFFLCTEALPEPLQLTGSGWVLGGVVAGSLLAELQRHPRRVLGLVPSGILGMALLTDWLALAEKPWPSLLVALGIFSGLVHRPLERTYRNDLPAGARGRGMAIPVILVGMAAAITILMLEVLVDPLEFAPETLLIFVAAAFPVLALCSAWVFRREALELLIEGVFLVMYRFRAARPGLATFPRQGPVLVIANHAAWLDPTWLAKVLPRRIIPMMTSKFYDMSVLRWLMVHVAGAIRVESGRIRREVPELAEAIAALDRGECVLIFPEGAMRRSEDQPLRMFGQGVWHILRERPATRVVVCWIEGGWGSYFSYAGGPPTKNKRLDWRRLIRIVVGVPHTISAEILADQRRTRLELMRECLALRGELGLEVPEAEEDPLAG
jgi:1-acyl-sn-glycerol-3-phosphate acyltransferase